MRIKENSKILKLSYIFNNYEEEITEAKQTKKGSQTRAFFWYKSK